MSQDKRTKKSKKASTATGARYALKSVPANQWWHPTPDGHLIVTQRGGDTPTYSVEEFHGKEVEAFRWWESCTEAQMEELREALTTGRSVVAAAPIQQTELAAYVSAREALVAMARDFLNRARHGAHVEPGALRFDVCIDENEADWLRDDLASRIVIQGESK